MPPLPQASFVDRTPKRTLPVILGTVGHALNRDGGTIDEVRDLLARTEKFIHILLFSRLSRDLRS